MDLKLKKMYTKLFVIGLKQNELTGSIKHFIIYLTYFLWLLKIGKKHYKLLLALQLTDSMENFTWKLLTTY